MLPVPPLDGSKLLLAARIPPAIYNEIARAGFLLLIVAVSISDIGRWMSQLELSGGRAHFQPWSGDSMNSNSSVFSLSGKSALVAGASRGIGLAIAQQMAEAGARTILAARSIDKLQRARAGARGKRLPGERAAHGYVASRRPLRSAIEGLETPDILVNVAGTNMRKRFAEYTKAEYDHILQTNLHGIVDLTQQIGARMVDAARAVRSSRSAA